MRNTVAKKRTRQEDVDSDYRFANVNRRVGPIRERLFSLAVLEIHYRRGYSLTQL
jgi:hypothetical protein